MKKISKDYKESETKDKQNDITPEFKIWVKEFMDEHDDVLRKLAKR